MYSNPFAPIQILTGDTRKPYGFLYRRLHDDGRSLQRKPRIERRFESQVAGRSPACFLVTFCTTQKVTTRSLCREHRGFPNLESAHSKQQIRTNKIRPFWNFSRFCKPRFSSPRWRLPTNKIKSFAASRQCPCRDSTLPRAFSAALGGIFRPLRGNSYFL